jgi:hypothetical protein
MLFASSYRSNLATLRTLVQTTTGRKDAEFANLIDKSINWSILTAALVCKPSELEELGYIHQNTGNWSVSLANGILYANRGALTIHSMSNAANKAFPVPPEMMWTLVTPIRAQGIPKYYAIHGRYWIIYDKYPASNIVWEVYYTAVPNQLVANSDLVCFAGHDEMIVSLASKLVFAAMEESDTANMWATLSKDIGGVLAANAQEGAFLRGELYRRFPGTQQQANQGGK